VTRVKRAGNTILLYDRRLSDLAPDPVKAPEALEPSAAPQGVSCDVHCRGLGKRCDNAW
jgi:hypothetical protein